MRFLTNFLLLTLLLLSSCQSGDTNKTASQPNDDGKKYRCFGISDWFFMQGESVTIQFKGT